MGRVADRADPGQLEDIAHERRALRIEIRGVVQGVGFRPFVYRLAQEHALVGWVRNLSWGVEIQVEGRGEALQAFVWHLGREAPPIARIESLTTCEISPEADGCGRFEILHSEAQEGAYQLVSPDVAICPDCLRELNDPQNRRYRYPFTNCTNCGPRFTIIRGIPYDRPLTTMSGFAMCSQCQREYDDPLDRRFHAQPNACPLCGPQVSLLDVRGEVVSERDEAMRQVAALLRTGKVIAIKGLGGYQLACDATNGEAVQRLRQRKLRPHKPFAVMVGDLAAVRRHAAVNQAESDLLASSAAPIVLLPWRDESHIAREVAPANGTIGIMLPYTPLHHILMQDVDLPLVMTSGNLSEEPIAAENGEALRRLGQCGGSDGEGIADFILTHSRDIHSRYDDSVYFVLGDAPQPIRRARGYAPAPVKLTQSMEPILACGPELKNTFCLTRDVYAFVSQHIGDMENLETLIHYEETVALYRRLFHVEPRVVAHDLHPDYATTRFASQQEGQKVAVQHHHAHFVSCLADRAHEGPAIGVIYDGTGYGLDGRIWGGEFLVGDAQGFQRAAHLGYLPLPGGDQAIRRPGRIAAAYMHSLAPALTWPHALEHLPDAERDALRLMIERGINSPLTSSAGRLFDAVSALLGICQITSYEAQAAIEMEQLALTVSSEMGYKPALDPYPVGWLVRDRPEEWGAPPVVMGRGLALDLAPMWHAILTDLEAGMPAAEIAWRFHLSMAALTAGVCAHLRECTGLDTVALSGGCFQNRLLLQLVLPRLESLGFKVLTHRQVPCNDGGVSLGQAVIAHHAVQRRS